MNNNDRREYARLKVNDIDCVLYDQTTGTEYTCSIVDISENGMCLKIDGLDNDPHRLSDFLYSHLNESKLPFMLYDSYTFCGKEFSKTIQGTVTLLHANSLSNGCVMVGGKVTHDIHYERYVQSKKVVSFINAQNRMPQRICK